MSLTLVLDVGKTHIKLHLIDEANASRFCVQTHNEVRYDGPYPCFDTEGHWLWVLESILSIDVVLRNEISGICITTHGAAAALIDRRAQSEHGLVLPIMDYEFSGLDECRERYEVLRPEFSETQSPSLPAGLNLGAQLCWQQASFPEEFAQVTDILMYPQYWAWRFSGELCSEVSSLGCHTDLWNGGAGVCSSLVERQGWRGLFPKVKAAWEVLGEIQPDLQQQLGLRKNCYVYVGVHDSNASFLRYLKKSQSFKRADNQVVEELFNVVSTGTWTISMSTATDADDLDPDRDMLCNTAVNSRLVACSRFMGGREYELICEKLGSSVDARVTESQLLRVLESGAMALPNFCPGTGPFPSASRQIMGECSPGDGAAIATLYCALMIHIQLSLLSAKGDIIVEGSFLKNPWLSRILASLRSSQRVLLSSDSTGTVIGCAELSRWAKAVPAPGLLVCEPVELAGLREYAGLWKKRVGES